MGITRRRRDGGLKTGITRPRPDGGVKKNYLYHFLSGRAEVWGK